ncbi:MULTISPECIES: 16S rRNA (uracil(1498)-N(3))-methyltransferase [Fusobacterium]|uniref:RsmE family RNA methyltransferase n=1 Tax=Fusobacterium TaxID=848 RepID=UPI001476ED32|nr:MULTISPECIES: 16S rRNA (uracil(1498)-N(3))-methyltransferase [Fusobacterium]NME35981.1 16S rRNA (uracil(1498)-N(3))-methyltransferase [Fusobacterium sp. FSA-380-WT-3A]
MITVVVEKKDISGSVIEVKDKNDINHLKNSFRIKENDIIRAVDGENEYICRVQTVEKKEIFLEIIEKKAAQKDEVEITAGISVIKNDKMELTIQKLTEVGIDKIIPIETKRTIVKLNEKKDKWDVISREAVKQCQRTKFLKIENLTKLKDIDFSQYDLIIVPYECEEDKKLKTLFNNLTINPKKILYIIGPEGGFDTEEIEFLENIEKTNIITLGRNILRAETASIVVGGILINEFK